MNQQKILDSLDISALSSSDQKRLKYLLAEANKRKIPIPEEATNKSLVRFPTDSKGYFVKRDGKFYIPTENQEKFILSDAMFDLFYGSRGSGKSAAGAQKVLRKVKAGGSGIIINPKFEDLKDTTWPEFRNWLPPEIVVPKDRYKLNPTWEPQRPFNIHFMNGERVILRGLKDPNSGRGPNLNFLWYDEGGSDPSGQAWLIGIASVRIGHNPQAWVTSTPNGIQHWMYDFFIDPDRQAEVLEIIKHIEKEWGQEILGDRKMTAYFQGSIEQNKANLDPLYYVRMKTSYTGWLETQEIGGEFVNKGGKIGDSAWFNNKQIDRIPEEIIIRKRVRYWDLAASEKKIIKNQSTTDPDKTVGTLFSWAREKDNQLINDKGVVTHNNLDSLPNYGGDNVFFIEGQESGWWEWLDIKEQVWQTALKDGYFVDIRIEQEPGAGGKNQIAEMKNFLAEKCKEAGIPVFNVEGHSPEGDKVQRANVWFAEAKDGHIYVVSGFWTREFFKILDGFGLIRHDDEVDSVSGARFTTAPIRTWKRIDFLSI